MNLFLDSISQIKVKKVTVSTKYISLRNFHT